MAREYEGEVQFIGVPSRDSVPPMEAFVARHGLEHVPQAIDLDAVVWQRLGVPGQPAWAFIDGERGTVEVQFGALGGDGLREAIARLKA